MIRMLINIWILEIILLSFIRQAQINQDIFSKHLSEIAIDIPLINPFPFADTKGSNTKTAKYLTNATAFPFVVIENENFGLYFQVSSPTIKSLIMILQSPWISVDGTPDLTIELFDNATHGDSISNDRIFSRTGLSVDLLSKIYSFSFQDIKYVFSDGHTEIINEPVGIRIICASPSEIDSVRIDSLAPDVLAMDYIVIISPGTTGPWTTHEYPSPQVERYYDFFPDDRDFLIACNTYSWSNIISGTHMQLNNLIRGTGQWIGQNGSKKNLRSFITLDVGYDNQTITHEILHDYAAYLKDV